MQLSEPHLPDDIHILALRTAEVELEAKPAAAFLPDRSIVFAHHFRPRAPVRRDGREFDQLLRG
jgi:hypothetical protein